MLPKLKKGNAEAFARKLFNEVVDDFAARIRAERRPGFKPALVRKMVAFLDRLSERSETIDARANPTHPLVMGLGEDWRKLALAAYAAGIAALLHSILNWMEAILPRDTSAFTMGHSMIERTVR